MANSDNQTTLRCETPAKWKSWLSRHGADSPGVWLQIAKKDSGIPSVTHAQALEEALCHGWIDGQRKGLDEQYFLQKFTPRRAGSLWSLINRDKALALAASGRMQPAGLAEVERAKADGRWDAAYTGQSRATVPEDLAALLEGKPDAKAFFATLTAQNRYAILFRLQTAKKPETRQRRLLQCVEMLERGEKFHP
ncbi:MAG: YdeI/OmpD-associated family protein [Polaromonas sp.]